ncbi:MAG: hypothetical protein MHM6MM_002985 [Cercozoa sp. M6MM]
MCGRIANGRTAAQIQNLVGGGHVVRYTSAPAPQANYNCGPAQQSTVVWMCNEAATPSKLDRSNSLQVESAKEVIPQEEVQPCLPTDTDSSAMDKLLVQSMQFGLIPSFSKTGKMEYTTFNARSETVQEKHMYRRLVRTRRCLVPIDGFYEWDKKASRSTPYFIKSARYVPSQVLPAKDDCKQESADHVLWLAAMFDVWHSNDPAEPPLFSFTVLTTNSGQKLGWLHDRQPITLDTPEARWRWLNSQNDFESLKDLIGPSSAIAWHEVSAQVLANRSETSAKCVESIDVVRKRAFNKGLGRFFKVVPKATKKKSTKPAGEATETMKALSTGDFDSKQDPSGTSTSTDRAVGDGSNGSSIVDLTGPDRDTSGS